MFNSHVSLLILCLDSLSIVGSEVLQSATVTVLVSTSPFISVSVSLIYLAASLLGAYVFMVVMSS